MKNDENEKPVDSLNCADNENLHVPLNFEDSEKKSDSEKRDESEKSAVSEKSDDLENSMELVK